MKRIVVPVLVCILFNIAAAGDKLLTLEEAILGSQRRLRVADIQGLQWITGTRTFCLIDSADGELYLVKGEIDSDSLIRLVPLKDLNAAVTNLKLNRFPDITWKSSNMFYFLHRSQLIIYDVVEKKGRMVNRVRGDGENVQIEPETFRLAFTRGNNLFIALEPEMEIQVTFEKDEAVRNGDPYVHRAEFGINKGIFWSPGGDHVAYYRKDERYVTEYPLVDLDSRPASLRLIRYPMTGMASEQVTIGVYHIKTGSTTFLQTGEPRDHYLACVTWSSDGRWLYVADINRDQDHLRMVQYDPETGLPVQILFEEKNEKWIEPRDGLLFAKGRSDRFLWFSKQDGYNHLYLYTIKEKKLRQLTRGSWDITRFSGFDETGDIAFFEAASEDGMERQGYRLHISTGKWRQVTSASGVHRLSPSGDGEYILDVFNNYHTPRTITLLDKRGKPLRTLLDAPNPLEEYALGEIRLFSIKNKEGIFLNARMILPPEFNSSKKYPVIVYVYGGPHGQMITNSWISGWRLWFLYMAQHDYIVFTLDNRGTDSRGLDFEQSVFRRLGTLEIEDQMTGVNYIKSQSFVDTTRIGVHGWSYGGFMTISLMSRKPGVFSTGVAGGPVIDWRYYEVMYGERYMDTPQANPDGYEESNLLNYVGQLEGNLLIIHGTVDPVVVWQNSLLYLKKAIDEGKQVNYFVYPGHEHNVSGRDRLHLYQTITDYFMDHL